MSDDAMMPFLQSLCEHAGIAIIATDEAFVIRFWNTAAERMFERPARSAIGQPIWLIIPPERHSLAQRLLERAVQRSETSELELRQSDSAGKTHHLAVTVSPIPATDGQVVGVSICVRDVTKGMELLRDVAETQRMAALALMAGAVAHHFNNLLGGAMTAMDFAQDAGDPDMLRRALKTAMSALTRVSGLTHGLLAFAEGDRTESPVGDAAAAVQQFVSRLRSEWAGQNIVLETDLQVHGARLPTRLFLIILEVLTTNACEAMVEGGTLRIELKKGPGTTVILRVCDTGAGIPEEQLRHVFEPFFTTKRATSPDEPEHLGLGLAVVHGIVKDLGGTITLEPREPAGIVCTVCLPVTIEPAR